MAIVTFNVQIMSLFTLSAFALLGSPGPGIAALVAIGRSRGFAGGLVFYLGLQLGLAMVAGASAFGLQTLLELNPRLSDVMTAVSAIYLLWLAWQIASVPVGNDIGTMRPAEFGAGFFLGLSNPKAYLAFASLFAWRRLVIGTNRADMLIKWAIIVMVIMVVDIVWLAAGAALGRAHLSTNAERILNVALGLTIVVSTAIAVL